MQTTTLSSFCNTQQTKLSNRHCCCQEPLKPGPPDFLGQCAKEWKTLSSHQIVGNTDSQAAPCFSWAATQWNLQKKWIRQSMSHHHRNNNIVIANIFRSLSKCLMQHHWVHQNQRLPHSSSSLLTSWHIKVFHPHQTVFMFSLLLLHCLFSTRSS